MAMCTTGADEMTGLWWFVQAFVFPTIQKSWYPRSRMNRSLPSSNQKALNCVPSPVFGHSRLLHGCRKSAIIETIVPPMHLHTSSQTWSCCQIIKPRSKLQLMHVSRPSLWQPLSSWFWIQFSFHFWAPFKAGQQDSDDVRQPMEISHDGLGPFDQPRSQRQKSQRKSLLYCYRRSNSRNAMKNWWFWVFWFHKVHNFPVAARFILLSWATSARSLQAFRSSSSPLFTSSCTIGRLEPEVACKELDDNMVGKYSKVIRHESL